MAVQIVDACGPSASGIRSRDCSAGRQAVLRPTRREEQRPTCVGREIQRLRTSCQSSLSALLRNCRKIGRPTRSTSPHLTARAGGSTYATTCAWPTFCQAVGGKPAPSSVQATSRPKANRSKIDDRERAWARLDRSRRASGSRQLRSRPSQGTHARRAQARSPRGAGGPHAFVSPSHGRSAACRPAEQSRDRIPDAVRPHAFSSRRRASATVIGEPLRRSI